MVAQQLGYSALPKNHMVGQKIFVENILGIPA
jgi:hypothetical protein